MQQHIQTEKLLFKKSRLLISGMSAKDILLSTSLLKWYMTKGMVVTKVSEVLEYCVGRPFHQFMEDVTRQRKEGARDPSKKIIAEMWKLIGNSG